jgi:hypothetical protein
MQMSATLNTLIIQVNRAAEFNVAQEIEQGGMQVTPLQRRSMVAVEAFRQTAGFDLVALMLRAYYLRKIQEDNLLSVHPSGEYPTLAAMASKNGCSATEMTFVIDFANVLAPYLSEIGVSVFEVWQALGKSKLKELMPVLKGLITGEHSDTQTTQEAVTRLLEETWAGMEVSELYQAEFEALNDERAPDEQRQELRAGLERRARQMTVRDLVDTAAELPTEELRRFLRPNTEMIGFYAFDMNGRQLLATEATPEQVSMLRNRLGERMQIQSMDLPTDPRARQSEAMRIPLLRNIFSLIRGER